MPFGLTNAPATLQRALDNILSGDKWQRCLMYLDSRSRGFGIMIRIKHRSVRSSFLPAATSYVHQSFHKETEHEMSFPAVSSVWLSHWMTR